ncbi:transposase [Streptomyces sp. NPDC015220]|uniref:transposase n=1 Tax=Streptomyces sp. NPDC015220 TaxID=3364947 RepID=UPI003703517C
MTDAEWQVIRAVLPVPAWLEGRGGRPESYCHRAMLDAVRHVVDNGVKWANLPVDFPPYRRVHAFARRWQVPGLLAELHDRLRDRVREKEDRSPDPTAAIADSQSLRAAANIPRSTSGWDGGKEVGGRKRHLVVDCLGLVLAVAVTAASVQDRDAAVPLLERLRQMYFSIRLVWTDGRRLCRAAGRLGGREPPPHPGDRQTHRRHMRLRGAAAQVGGWKERSAG